MIRVIILVFIYCFTITKLIAQENSSAILTPREIEHIFLEQNLELLAEEMNISIADATIAQAKLWDNPTLTISDLNLWTTRTQREDETIPPLFGSFGKNTEFSVELSQLIQTANKRGKLIRMEKVSKEIAIKQFEETLRGLKTELRQNVYEIIYLQAYLNVLKSQATSLSQLSENYKQQVAQGNLAKAELLRLQAALFETENEQIEIAVELNALQKELKVLLNIPATMNIGIVSGGQTDVNPNRLSLSELIDLASESRPDLKMAYLQTNFLEKSLAVEKAQRTPDITVSANYDRYGGVWKNFIGFGVSVDLPFLNRNQGNIKAAKLSLEQNHYLTQQSQNLVENEIAEALNNYKLMYSFYTRIQENTFLEEIDDMQQIYAKNLLDRNISMMEYIDFMESYKNNKQTILNAEKNLADKLEELQYTIGTDLK